MINYMLFFISLLFYWANNKRCRFMNLNNTQETYTGTDELYDTEICLKKFNLLIAKILSSYFDKNSNIADFGAGIGTIAVIMENIIGIKPTCIEPDTLLGKILKERGFSVYKSMKAAACLYDGVYTSNVLEHIKNDVGALKEIHDSLKHNGVLAIYVPAFMCLYSEMDRKIGHYRRYSKNELIQKLNAAKYKIIQCHYCDSVGFFASLAIKLFGFKERSILGGQKSLKIYDKYITPVSKILDNFGFKYLFGKNLLVIAKKL